MQILRNQQNSNCMKSSKSTMFIVTFSFALLCLLMFGQRSNTQSIENSLPIITHFENAKSFQFAETQHVNFTTENSGTWSENEDYLLWEKTFSTEGTSLNFYFSEIRLTEHTILQVLNMTSNRLLKLDAHSKIKNDEYWSPIFDQRVIKLQIKLPKEERHHLKLRISAINHGIHLANERSSSERSCLIDVVCGEADQLPIIDQNRDIIQSVGLITIDGTGICTGVLINNTSNDRTPYFLTARHCGIDITNVASVNVYWNYQNSFCRSDASSNEFEGDGKYDVFNQGASIVAEYREADMMLLKLDEAVNPAANAFFAGWNNSNLKPSNTVTIHHAYSEEKRISFDNDVPQITRHFGVEEDLDLDHFRVLAYDISSTAEGSSGAPLFNQNKEVVGILHGGLADCGNQESDWYGRFYNSWLGDELPERQLKPWLDPINSGSESIGGIWANKSIVLDLQVTQMQEIACNGDETAVLSLMATGGIEPYRYSINGGATFTGSNSFANLAAGIYNLIVEDSDGNTSEVQTFTITEPTELTGSSNFFYNLLKIKVEGGVPPYVYSINGGPSQEEPCFYELSNALYKISILDANSCMFEFEVELSLATFLAEVVVIQDLDCVQSASGQVLVNVLQGGYPPFYYSIDGQTFQAEPQFDELSSGSYVFTVQDAIGNLIQTDSITLGDHPNQLLLDIETFEDFIVLNASGGSGTYTYSIDGVNFQKSNIFENLGPGVYEAFVMDSNGCIVSISLEIPVSIFTLRAKSLTISPNPASNVLKIDFPIIENVYEVSIVNLMGQEFEVNTIKKGESQLTLDVESLNNGLYYCQLRSVKNNIRYLGSFFVNK